MLQLSMNEVAQATAAEVLVGGDGHISRVVIDSREAEEGTLFVCFAGERVDGNAYAPAAVERGAAAVLLTAEPDESLLATAHARGCTVFRAQDDDATEFMLRLAKAWRAQNPQWIVVGVTGSVGKTTTKDMLAAGLSVDGTVHATAGNHNNLIGLSLTILSADASDKYVVCEMGMDHVGEMDRLTAVAKPDMALITNVGTSHIGILGSREAIAREKASIVHGMRRSDDASASVTSRLVITENNDFGALIEDDYARLAGVKVTRVGTTEACPVQAKSVSIDDQGRPTINVAFSDGCELFTTLDMPGAHVVPDFLLAMAIIWKLGVDRAHAAEAIAHMPRTGMRLEIKQVAGRPRVIDDSYNASPNSMAGALDVLCSMACTGRRVAVLGEIGELGDEAERLHGYIGAYAAAKPLDLLVIIGSTNASYMEAAALTMGFSSDRLERFADGASALAALADVFDEDDLVLVKASRFVGLDAFAKGVLS